MNKWHLKRLQCNALYRTACGMLAVLQIALLTGCGTVEQWLPALSAIQEEQQAPTPIWDEDVDLESYYRGRNPVHFSELVYRRPDLVEMERQVDELIVGIRKSETLGDALEHLKSARDLFCAYDTMYVLCDIQHDINQLDKYWIDELQFCDDGIEQCNELWDRVYAAVERSKFRKQLLPLWNLSQDQAALSSSNSTASDELFTAMDKIVDEALDIIQDSTVQYEGEELTLDAAEAREDWIEACVAWYDLYGEELLELYTDMVRIGNVVAQEYYHFDNYAEYLFQSYQRDYTPQMALSMVEQIVEHVIPLDGKISKAGYWSGVYEYYGDFDDCMEKTRIVLKEMDPKMVEALDCLQEYGLYYIQVGDNMYSRAYVNHLATPNVPFMFCPYSDDLVSFGDFTHEFGHFYEIYLTMDDSCTSDDLSEVHSQAMSLLFAEMYRTQYNDDALLDHMIANTVRAIKSQSYHAAIELQVFSLEEDELSAEAIGQIAYEETTRYGYGKKHEVLARFTWLTDTEVFTDPLQPFCYSVSACVALDLWRLSMQEMDTALEKYEQLVYRNGRHRLLTNISAAGIKSPFRDEWMENMTAFLEEYMVLEDESTAA